MQAMSSVKNNRNYISLELEVVKALALWYNEEEYYPSSSEIWIHKLCCCICEVIILSVYENAKDFIEDWTKFTIDGHAVGKVVNLLNLASSISIILIFLNMYWDIVRYAHMPVPPIFAAPFKAFLDMYTFPLLVILLLYYLFRGALWHGVNFLSDKLEQNLLPLWNTIEELYEVFVIAIITLFFIDELIESLHKVVVSIEVCNFTPKE